jgi:hypothetical protein
MARQEGAYKLGKSLIQGLAGLIREQKLNRMIHHGPYGETYSYELTDRNTALIKPVLSKALWDAGFIDAAQVIDSAMKTYEIREEERNGANVQE